MPPRSSSKGGAWTNGAFQARQISSKAGPSTGKRAWCRKTAAMFAWPASKLVPATFATMVVLSPVDTNLDTNPGESVRTSANSGGH